MSCLFGGEGTSMRGNGSEVKEETVCSEDSCLSCLLFYLREYGRVI